jgi:hypothetical protein
MQYTFQLQSMVQNRTNQDGVGTSLVPDQLHEISSPESVTNQRRGVIIGIQPKFVYEFTFLDYYELMEHWQVDEITNVGVFEEIEENHPWPFEYVEA